MPIDRTPWTDDTVMPWGKHEGAQLKSVPADYLLWLYRQPWIREWPGLHGYLKSREDILIAEEQERRAEEKPAEFDSYDDYLRDYRGF